MELLIQGMDCANCAKTLEEGIRQLEGVEACQVNFLSGKLHLTGEVPLATLSARIEALGYQVGTAQSANDSRPDPMGIGRYFAQNRQTQVVLAGLVVLALSFGLSLAGAPLWIVQALELAIVLALGGPIMRLGLREAWMSRRITINFLMSIAVLGALLIGEWGEAATVIALFALGEALEGYTADRARHAIQSLTHLVPQEAFVWRDEEQQKVPVEQVTLDDLIFIPPGARIPLDGIITSGQSTVDQAPITGESMPQEKAPGDAIYAGSINGVSLLQARVTSLAQDSTLSRIVRLVEQAQANKAPSERFVDRFAAWYTPSVIVLALAVVVIPPLLWGAPLETWLYRGLALLVVACPCALVISTPVTVVSAMVQAAQHGILIKGGQYLEALGKVKVFAFDKTGTLTQGKPQVVAVQASACQSSDECCAACDDVLAYAYSLEQHSQHPLALAIQESAQARGLTQRHALAQEVTTLVGRGLQGQVGSAQISIGSHRYFDTAFPHPEALCQRIQQHESEGQTVMLVAKDQQVLGYISAADSIRPSAKAALQALQRVHTVMLTGDHGKVAERIGQTVGVQSVQADLLPQDKAAAVQALAQRYGSVAMVGDGINDAPALAAATVGIAMGGAGSAQAMETADVVLMQDDLSQLPCAIALSQQASHIIRQNITLSLAIKAAFMLLTLPGLTTLWMAVFADMGMSLLVTFNGLRLLRQRPPA
jgi:Cd2+/Zn2+-exporting ATPase